MLYILLDYCLFLTWWRDDDKVVQITKKMNAEEASDKARRIDLGAAKQAPYEQVKELCIFEGQIRYTIKESKSSVIQWCRQNNTNAILDCNWIHYFIDKNGSIKELGNANRNILAFADLLKD